MKLLIPSILLVSCCLFSLTASAQLVSDSIEVEKNFRRFHFNRPENSKKNKSLIFVLHGSGGNGKEKGKPEVTLLKVIGGKHDYPGDIDVYLEAWAFFRR